MELYKYCIIWLLVLIGNHVFVICDNSTTEATDGTSKGISGGILAEDELTTGGNIVTTTTSSNEQQELLTPPPGIVDVGKTEKPGHRNKTGGKDDDGGGGKAGLKAGLIVLLLVGIAILAGLITCFICYVRKGKLMRKNARAEASRIRRRHRGDATAAYVNVNGNGHAHIDANGAPAFFVTSETNTDRARAQPDNRRMIYRATVGDEASTAVVCEQRPPTMELGANERAVDIDSQLQNRYVSKETLDQNANPQSSKHQYPGQHNSCGGTDPKKSNFAQNQVDAATNLYNDPANNVYSQPDEGRVASAANYARPSASGRNGEDVYEEINENELNDRRQIEARYSDNREAETKKGSSSLAPPDVSDDENSVIEQFNEVLEKYTEESSEKSTPNQTPTKLPTNLRVRRDSWVQDEGDEVKLSELRKQYSTESMNGSTRSVQGSPPLNEGHVYSNVHGSSPSKKKRDNENMKAAQASGSTLNDSMGSTCSSIKSDMFKKTDASNSAEATYANVNNVNSGARTDTVDSDQSVEDGVTDNGKLHNVTCLSLPPVPTVTQKSLTQTSSYTATPPSAEQVRRDSLLGSLPPLEPIGMGSDLAADISTALGDTPVGIKLSKRKKKHSLLTSPKHKIKLVKDRRHSVDVPDQNRRDNHTDISKKRAQLLKSGSLDDGNFTDEFKSRSAGRHLTETPDEMQESVLKRSGSLRGSSHGRTKEEASRARPHSAKKTASNRQNATRPSSGKRRESKAKEITDLSENDFNTTGDSEILESSMKLKTSQLVKNAIEGAARDSLNDAEKKTGDKKNPFKDLYNMVNWGANMGDSGNAGSSSRKHERRRYSVDNLLDSEDEAGSPRSNSRERLTPRSREKRRSKRDSGHVSDDELLSARSKHKHGHGIDNPAYQRDTDSERQRKSRQHKKEAHNGNQQRHHKHRHGHGHHKKHRSHRRDGETEEEYQERKRRHRERKESRSNHKIQQQKTNESATESDTDHSGEDTGSTEMNGIKPRRDSWFSSAGALENKTNNEVSKQPQKGNDAFCIQDMELDNSFEV